MKRHPFALALGKPLLYKFRPYGTPEEKRRVREILIDHKVYFARASQLNDPFDLSPRFQIGSRDELLAAARSLVEREPDRAAGIVDLEYLEKCDIVEHVANATARARDRLEKRYPVFSLAGNNTHPMLWSHYAGGHTGVCIHFRTDARGGWFGFALKVEYVDERPILPALVGSLSDRELFERIALRKGKFWSYEDEYRWIRFPDVDLAGIKISFEGQHARFRAAALDGITVGARMPASSVDELLAIADAHVPSLPVWQARETDAFAFEFHRLL